LSLISDSRLLLNALKRGVSDEVYLIDASSMQLVCASESVLKNWCCDLQGLKQLSLDSLLGVSQQTLYEHVSCHRHQTHFVELLLDPALSSGNINNDQLRVMLIQSGQQEFILVIKKDFSFKEEVMRALSESESRFQAIVSNTPGLVFQFQLNREGEMTFVYLSEGCKALLGLSSEALKQDSNLFYAMMNASDCISLRKHLELSTIELSMLNWEGMVWIDDWQDTKWINVRSIPRVLNNGVIQWEGIMTNITQSKNEKHEIEQSHRDLAELSAHMDQIKEQERSRISREIHDDLGGNLTAIKIGLSSIINQLGTGQKILVEQARNLESIVDNTFEAVHRISRDLRPNILDLGIVAALEWQSKEFEKQLDIAFRFSCSQVEIPVTADQAIALFRIYQESISNIAKHAKATVVSVNLSASAHEIEMMISDNGVGIKSSDMLKVNSFGLRGMQERVAALNGSFNIANSSNLGKPGTVITIRFPIESGK